MLAAYTVPKGPVNFLPPAFTGPLGTVWQPQPAAAPNTALPRAISAGSAAPATPVEKSNTHATTTNRIMSPLLTRLAVSSFHRSGGRVFVSRPAGPGPGRPRRQPLRRDRDLVEEEVERGVELEPGDLLGAGGVLHRVVHEDPRRVLHHQLLDLSIEIPTLLQIRDAARLGQQLVHLGVVVGPATKTTLAVDGEAQHRRRIAGVQHERHRRHVCVLAEALAVVVQVRAPLEGLDGGLHADR